MIHKLKTHPEYFEAVLQGRKNFEIRQNDRNFKVGDWLELHEYDPKTNEYTARVILTRVSYMTDFAQQPGFVVMAIKEPKLCENPRRIWEKNENEISQVKHLR